MNVLFVHGAGEGAHAEDLTLAHSLQRSLGDGIEVRSPAMPREEDPDYEAWKQRIVAELDELTGPVALVGHSIGGSVLARAIAEIDVSKVAGLFLVSAPFWGGGGWTYEGYETLTMTGPVPEHLPVFLYHGRDDEIVPIDHLRLFHEAIESATAREVDAAGHQLNDDLSVVASDIRAL